MPSWLAVASGLSTKPKYSATPRATASADRTAHPSIVHKSHRARAGDGLARIEVGSRVRVTAPAIYEGRLVGHVIAFIPDTLLIEQKLFTRWKVPEADIELIEVSLERKSRAGTGALIGAGTIAAAGVGTALVGCADSDCTLFFYAALGATLVGAGIGALIGSQIKVDRWEEVPLDRIRVSLTPSGGGLEVTAKFVF